MSVRAATALAAALAALVLAGCGSGTRHVAVTPGGRIGPLHVDRSDRAAVISFAGRPSSERRGRYAVGRPYDALGYGCDGRPATDGAGVPRCETVFYLDARSGKLALMYTEDARYVYGRSVHAGALTSVVERELHQRASVGCYSGFRLDTKTGYLVLWLGGGPAKALVGKRVEFLVVHSRRLNPRVLDCIDS